MQLTDKDRELFKALAASGIGADLRDYLDRLCNHVCDSRNWGENDTKESSNQTALNIKLHIKNRLISNDKKEEKEALTDYE